MLTRLKIESGARLGGGLVVALAVAATLAVYLDAHGQKAPDHVALLDEHANRASPAEKLQMADVDPADAVPSCLDPRAAQHSLFVAGSLLRMPFLVSEAAGGTCR